MFRFSVDSSRTLPEGARPPGRARAGLAAFIFLVAGSFGGVWYARAHFWPPREQLVAARQALERRDIAGAEEQLEQYQQEWPKDAAVHFLLARAARMDNDLDRAERELALCERLQDDKPDLEIGDTGLERGLVEAQRGKLLDVETYLRRRIREGHPDLLFILDVVSRQLMLSWRLEEALACLDIWLEQKPEDCEALVRHGWVCEHRRQVQQAIIDYREALDVDPIQDLVRLRVAELLVQENRPAEALEDIEAVIMRLPDNLEAALCLARCQRGLGRSREAIPILDDLLARNGNNAQALAERGIVALGEGQSAQAEQLLRRAVKQDPLNKLINYNLLQCLQRLGKKDEIKTLEAHLALADAGLARMDQLLPEVMRAPHDAGLRYEAGMIFLQNGFAGDGVYWLGAALKEDPGHRPSHEALAKYYDAAGDKDRADWHRSFLH
jgi:tetratricopeptide (TPR) repeat protein